MVSLDDESFIRPVKSRGPPIEAYHVSEFSP
ncbi:TPA: acyltransferase [Candidatus Bathyarchaeota archaeon]|nr:acyltransferase [Candidatus Bathyarchaeota archaeon]